MPASVPRPQATSVLLAARSADLRAELRAAIEADAQLAVCGEAGDAAAAVGKAPRLRPDICLIDAELPGGGLGAVWEIAARLPHTKIVVLAPSLDRRDLLATLRAGAHGYLPRGMSRERLVHALRDVASGEAAIPRHLVAGLVDEFRDTAARRRPVQTKALGAQLTGREWQVVDLLLAGLGTAEIARRLVLSQATVRSHIASALKKAGVADREGLLRVFGGRRAAGGDGGR